MSEANTGPTPQVTAQQQFNGFVWECPTCKEPNLIELKNDRRLPVKCPKCQAFAIITGIVTI